MATVNSHVTNGVSIAISHTVTTQDVSDGYVEIDFGIDTELVPIVQALDNTGAVEVLDAVVTQPSNGVIRVTDSGTFALVADHVINIICNRQPV